MPNNFMLNNRCIRVCAYVRMCMYVCVFLGKRMIHIYILVLTLTLEAQAVRALTGQFQ